MTGDELEARASATAEMLLGGAPEVLTTILDIYTGSCREVGEEPARLSATDRPRMVFEIVMFWAFLIMAQEAEKHIRRRRLLFTEPDADAIRRFNVMLLGRLEEVFRGDGFREVRERRLNAQLDWEDGELIGSRVRDRLDLYWKTVRGAGGAAKAIERFAGCLADSVGVETFYVMKTVGVKSAGSLAKMAGAALKDAFRE